MQAMVMKFEDLKLNYGFSLQLQVGIAAGQTERFSSRLIGCLPGHSIILSVPKSDGQLLRLKVNQKVIVRLMIDNGIAMFASEVEMQTYEPYPLLHIVYPHDVSFKGIRSATRVAVDLLMTAENLSIQANTWNGHISDISIAGARMEMPAGAFTVNDQIYIRVPIIIRGIARELEVKGVVRSLIDLADPSHPDVAGYGVEFLVQSEEQQLLLYAYVFSEMAAKEVAFSVIAAEK
jgi:c-di-GMP-binding flagellar brake protein YcgR